MAQTDIHVNGRCDIYIDAGSSLEALGFTIDGVTIRLINHEEDVFTDYNGKGIPYDVLYMGEEAQIFCDFIQWNEATMNKVRARLKSGTAGTNGTYGTLYGAAGADKTIRLVLKVPGTTTAEVAHNFPKVFAMGEITLDIGTKASRMKVTFRALPSAGILYNSTAT